MFGITKGLGREAWGWEGKSSYPCCHGTESWQQKMEKMFPQVLADRNKMKGKEGNDRLKKEKLKKSIGRK